MEIPGESRQRRIVLLYTVRPGFSFNKSQYPFEGESARLARLREIFGDSVSFESSHQPDFQWADGFCHDALRVEIKERTPGKLEDAVEKYLATAGTPSSVVMEDDWSAIARYAESQCMEILKNGRLVNRGLVCEDY